MKVYDKAAWHIDAGEDKNDVLKRYQILLDYLSSNNLLTAEGKELAELGADYSAVLHSRMLTDKGNELIDANIDNIISCELCDLEEYLEKIKL